MTDYIKKTLSKGERADAEAQSALTAKDERSEAHKELRHGGLATIRISSPDIG